MPNYLISGNFVIPTQRVCYIQWLFLKCSWARCVHKYWILVIATLPNFSHFRYFYVTRLLNPWCFTFIFIGAKCTYMSFSMFKMRFLITTYVRKMCSEFHHFVIHCFRGRNCRASESEKFFLMFHIIFFSMNSDIKFISEVNCWNLTSSLPELWKASIPLCTAPLNVVLISLPTKV